MMSLNREFVSSFPETGVILSPRPCTPQQMVRHAEELHELDAFVLFDPQFYQPRTLHGNIVQYPYWPRVTFNTQTFRTDDAQELCRRVVEYQVGTLNVDAIIAPGRYTNTLTEGWLELQAIFAQTAYEMRAGLPVYSTLAIGPDVVLNTDGFNTLLDELVAYPVNGVYVVLYHPNGRFMVNSEEYIYNLLDGFLSIALAGKDIILGYSNQQCLLYAAAGVTGLASGNFRNVRAFDPQLFEKPDGGQQQRGIWYYDANTLSEYRPQQLALAFRRRLREFLGPECEYCRALLRSNNPAAVMWREPLPFFHYLVELRRQWLMLGEVAPALRVSEVERVFETAETVLTTLVERGFRPGERSFGPYFTPSLGALTAFGTDRAADIARLT